MNLITADFVILCDQSGTIIEDGAVAFDGKIIEAGTKERLQAKYRTATLIECGKNSVLMPSLINAHTHLEFCKNKTTLVYGNFIDWLTSVIENRESLLEGDIEQAIRDTLEGMLRQGIGAIGAISSFGLDLAACVGASQKTVFFNEILGANEARFESIEADFTSRFERSMRFSNGKFRPAVSLHSAYSTHPKLAQKVVELAKEHDLPIVAHFMESKAERAWIDRNKGEFKLFFKNMFSLEKSFWEPQEFIKLLEGSNHGFIHCNYATARELELMRYQNGTVVHCPVSNRLLGADALNIELLKNLNINYVVATDGLSSNFSTSLFDELRAALFTHYGLNIHILAQDLLRSVTANAAALLGLDSGTIEAGKAADLISITLPGAATMQNVALNTILHTKEVDAIYINGERHA